MEEFLRYIAIIKGLLDNDYEKQRVFYDKGVWYDRHTCKNLTLDELEKEVLTIGFQVKHDEEYIRQIVDKLYELMGEEEAEKFLDSLDQK